ncbi:hypothetical protein BraRD5C2_58510 [Bradyrhizobium sp. RD5-C2]|nr:hypothetical protein BraRD5C2_58510 [Bradyrhizobium sp. RD5-C2]
MFQQNDPLCLIVSWAPADLLTQTSTLDGSVDTEQPAVNVKPCLPGRAPVVTIDTAPGTLRMALRNSVLLNTGLS